MAEQKSSGIVDKSEPLGFLGTIDLNNSINWLLQKSGLVTSASPLYRTS
jgi:hypothetical protein